MTTAKVGTQGWAPAVTVGESPGARFVRLYLDLTWAMSRSRSHEDDVWSKLLAARYQVELQGIADAGSLETWRRRVEKGSL